MSVVTSVEFQRNLGRYQDKALIEPVTITKNGRERLVLLSVDEYQRLKGRNGIPAKTSRSETSPEVKTQAQVSAKIDALSQSLRESFAPYLHAIRSAFVYGSVANGTDTERSDIDLMVVGDGLNYSDLYAAAQDAELSLGRKVSATFLTSEEWRRKASQKGSFVSKIDTLPKVFVIGSQKELQA